MSLRDLFPTATATPSNQSEAPISPLLNAIVVLSASSERFRMLLSPEHIVVVNPHLPPPFSGLGVAPQHLSPCLAAAQLLQNPLTNLPTLHHATIGNFCSQHHNASPYGHSESIFAIVALEYPR